jgi:hypothetical protein
MARIEIASASERRGASGRPLMSDHNLSARIWALLDPAIAEGGGDEDGGQRGHAGI